MIKKNFYFSKEQINKLEKEASKTGINVSEILRRIVDLYFGDKEVSGDDKTT